MARTALVVDDSRVARMMLSKLLIANGFDVVEQNSGEAAVEYLQSDAPNPNVIFMDIIMGGIDGLTATKQIKANPKIAAIPVVICTGNDTEEDKKEALATGAITVLSKPPANGVLMDVIGELAAHMVLEKAEPVSITTPAVIDEAALLAKIIVNIEQTIVPRIQLGLRDTAETLGRQIAEETAKKVVTEQLVTVLDSHIPEIKEQITTHVKVITVELARQTIAEITPEVVAIDVKNAVNSMMSEVDFSTPAVNAVTLSGTDWLNKQEQVLREKLEQSLNVSVAQNLESTLEKAASPIVTELVNRQLTQQTVDNKNDEVIENLNKKVSMLNSLVIGLAIVVIAVGVVTFLN